MFKKIFSRNFPRCLHKNRVRPLFLSQTFQNTYSTQSAHHQHLNLSPSSQEFYNKVIHFEGQNHGSVYLDTSHPYVARLVLDNPASRNCITGRMMRQLADAVDELLAYKGVACTVQGSGGYFCAGADLELVGTHLQSRAQGMQMSRSHPTRLHPFYTYIHSMQVPQQTS